MLMSGQYDDQPGSTRLADVSASQKLVGIIKIVIELKVVMNTCLAFNLDGTVQTVIYFKVLMNRLQIYFYRPVFNICY